MLILGVSILNKSCWNYYASIKQMYKNLGKVLDKVPMLRSRRKCFLWISPYHDILSLTWLNLLNVIYLNLMISHSAPTYFGTGPK